MSYQPQTPYSGPVVFVSRRPLVRSVMNLHIGNRRVAILSIVALVLVAGFMGLVPRGATQQSVASSPLVNCGRGIPAEKCDPSLYTPFNLQPPAQPIKPPTPFWPSSSIVSCGSTFFSTATGDLLRKQFGTIRCFKFSDKSNWIVTGDGGTPDGQSATPGGAIIAVDSCVTGDSACLDPNTQHDFGGFTVSYPPLPNSFPTNTEATFGGRLLYIADAYCGLFTFDTSTGQWFGHSAADIDSRMSGIGQATSVAAPPAVMGNVAIQNPAPVVIGACSGVVK